MVVGIVKLKILAPWVHSLKEKRMVVKSIIAKVQNKFNVSISEVEDQDIHQSIVIAYAFIAGNSAQADSISDHVLNFIEECTEGEIVQIEKELINS